MKVTVSFGVEVALLKEFVDAVEANNDCPYEVIEELMRGYVKDGGGEELTGKELTEQLLMNCKEYAVGEFVKIVLRELLEAGVASEDEISEMQKASGSRSQKKYHTDWGKYNSGNFKTGLPLLITERQKNEYDMPQQFYNESLTVYEQKYHLPMTWGELNREPIENWIRAHLPKWFDEVATAEQKSAMIKFVKSR